MSRKPGSRCKCLRRLVYTEAVGATKTLLTAEEFDRYPFEEDKRYELDEGELIEMTRPAYSVEVWTGPVLPDRALLETDILASSLLPGFALALADLVA